MSQHNPDAIKVALCSDATYAPHLATTLQSIFESNRDADLDVHVLCTDVDPLTAERLQQVAAPFGRTLHLHAPDIGRFLHLGVSAHFSHAIYLRLLLPELFPDADRLIYLDCDLIVEAPLAELWAVDVAGHGCAGMPEGGTHTLERLGLQGDRYVNSGVLLLNLADWREHDTARRCLAWLEANRELAQMPDQDAINVVLKGRKIFLDEKWNLNPAATGRPESLAQNPQRIVHFAGPYKAWHRYYDFDISERYRRYRAVTPWGEGFRFKEPETLPQALLVAHQFVRHDAAREAVGYFEQAIALVLARRKLDSMLQLRTVNVARALAGAGDFGHACDLYRAAFEHWGFPYEYQGNLYAYPAEAR